MRVLRFTILILILAIIVRQDILRLNNDGNVKQQTQIIDISQKAKVNQQFDILQVRKYHRLQTLICWGVLSDLGLISIRYLKYFKVWNKWYQIIHIVLFVLIFLSQTISMIFMIYTWPIADKLKKDKRITQFTAHIVIGSIHYFLMFSQLLVGFLARYSINHPVSIFKTKTALFLFSIHRFNGFFIYFLSKIQFLIGNLTNLTKKNVDQDVLIIFIIEVIIILLLEIIIRNKGFQNWQGQNKKIINQLTEEQQQLVNDILNNNKQNYQLKHQFNKINWVIYRNGIYDISNLNHPGGQNIFASIKGREISRFIYGAYSIEQSDLNAINKHSRLAINLLQKYQIGNLEEQNNQYINNNQQDQQQQLSSNLINNIIQQDEEWQLEQKQKLTSNIYLYRLKNNKQNINNLQHLIVKDFGKHYEIEMNNKIRLYSQVNCMQVKHQNLIETIKNSDKSQVDQSSLYNEDESLPLVIKRYEKIDGISYQMSELQERQKVILRGPFGRGLELNNNSSGLHTILCAGTGILPFLDLIYYLLLKYINSNKLPYQNLNNFTLNLFAAFQDQASFIGRDIIELYQNLSKEISYQQMDLFKCQIKFKQNPQLNQNNVLQQFDYNFLKDNINLKSAQIYICGPPQFNSDIYKNLIKLNYDSNKISFV